MSNVSPEVEESDLTTVNPVSSEIPSPCSCNRSRSARCSPKLRKYRFALNHCSPKGRLRLIQFLQGLNLDKALQNLPDECTLEDLLPISYDVLRYTFVDILTEIETNQLWRSLQNVNTGKGTVRSPVPACRSYTCSDLSEVNQSLSSSISGSPVGQCKDGAFNGNDEICYETEKDDFGSGARTSSPYPESTLPPSTKVVSDTVDQTSGLQRTASLDVSDCHRFSRFRPASLSVTVPSPTSFLSSTEVVGNSSAGGYSSLAPALLGGIKASPFSISPHCYFFDKHRRRSGERGYGIISGGGGGGGVWETATSSFGTSSMSHRSSLHLMPPGNQSQLSNPLSTLSPCCPSHLGHSIGSNLLKIRQGLMGQSAPNLFLSCRDNLGCDSSACGLLTDLPVNAVPASVSPNSSLSRVEFCRSPHCRFLSGDESSDFTPTVPLTTNSHSIALTDTSLGRSVTGAAQFCSGRSGAATTTYPRISALTTRPHVNTPNIEDPHLVQPMTDVRQVPGEEGIVANSSQSHQQRSGTALNLGVAKERPKLGCGDGGSVGGGKGVCQLCGTLTDLTPLQRNSPLNIPAYLQLSENRRWSLPSSGYGTNTPGSSNVSSHYSSKENVQISQISTHSRHPISSGHHPTSFNSTISASFSTDTHFSFTRDSLTPKPSHRAANTTTKPPASSRLSAVPSKPSLEHSSSRNVTDPSTLSICTPIKRLTPPPPLLCPKCLKGKTPPPPLSPQVPIQADVSSYTTATTTTTTSTPVNTKETETLPTYHPPQQTPNLVTLRQRSKSLSPVRCQPNNEHDILLLNHIYHERFPKASAQMQDNLKRLCEEMDLEHTFAWTAVARFMHKQVLELARDCLEKALAGLITCRYFFELTERLEKLVSDTRDKCVESTACVTTLCNRLLLIISRPARLLECLEFDPCEFYQMLEVAENHVRLQQQQQQQNDSNDVFCPDVPRYIISKLGLSKPADSVYIPNEHAGNLVAGAKIFPHENAEVSAPSTPMHRQPLSTDSGGPAGVAVSRGRPCEADFEIIKLISNGAYGAVFLVRDRITRERYGMKKIQKQHLRLRNQVEQVFAERDILSFADNPFVVSLYCTFETKKSLCLVMEFVEGGDVATLLKNIGGPLPDDLAQMYFAELVLALEYLHNYGIVHRDLKPDNLLITHEGHIKLTDFGLSRIGLMNMATNFYERSLDLEKDCKMFRDKHVFGTPEYIAPEVILRQGYGKPVDWWASGIILYEFLVGIVPFVGETIEELFTQIVSGTIEWPAEEGEEGCLSVEATSLITQLLERDPLLRLGTETGATEVKVAAFFGGLDWHNLLRQKAAFVPQLEHEEDCSYFDPRTDRYQHEVDDDEDLDDDDLVYAQGPPSFSSDSSMVSSCSRSVSKERSTEPPPKALNEEANATLTPAEGRLTAERLHSVISRANSPAEGPVSEANDEVLPDETLFHAFVSCSPRFSIAIERAAMELPQSPKEPDDVDLSAVELEATPTEAEDDECDAIPKESPSITLSTESNDPGQQRRNSPLAPHLQSAEPEGLTSPEFSKGSSVVRLNSSLTKMVLVETVEVDARPRCGTNQSKSPVNPPHQLPSTALSSDSDSRSSTRSTLASSGFRRPRPSRLPIPSCAKSTSPHRSLAPGSIVSPTTTKTTIGPTPARQLQPDVVDNSALTRTVLVTRGARGFGFTLRAKDVFFGSSDVYTLHHIVVWVDRKGPAFAAGLRENDLIVRVNDRSVVGRLHTEVVQLICSSATRLRLCVTPFSQSNIRSDGHWRARGRLVSRPSHCTKGQQQQQAPVSRVSKPSSGDESGLEGVVSVTAATTSRGRRVWARGMGGSNSPAKFRTHVFNQQAAQSSPAVIERRHRHKQLAPGVVNPTVMRQTTGVALTQPRQHSHSFSVHTSANLDSGAPANKMRFQPRRSRETPLFRQLSERNRCMAQSAALEGTLAQMPGAQDSSSSSSGLFEDMGKETSSRASSPLILLPFDEFDGGAYKPGLCVTPPASSSPKLLTSPSIYQKMAASPLPSSASPKPVSNDAPSCSSSAIPVRPNHHHHHRQNASSPKFQPLPNSSTAASSPSRGPTDM